jgi:hypothetical protein
MTDALKNAVPCAIPNRQVGFRPKRGEMCGTQVELWGRMEAVMNMRRLWLVLPALLLAAFSPAQPTGNLPLNDLGTGLYLGLYEGGLYPGGLNVMPVAHAAEGAARAAAVQPLDPAGNPDPDGKYVLLSIGMSNTHMEFCGPARLERYCRVQAFETKAAADPAVERG